MRRLLVQPAPGFICRDLHRQALGQRQGELKSSFAAAAQLVRATSGVGSRGKILKILAARRCFPHPKPDIAQCGRHVRFVSHKQTLNVQAARLGFVKMAFNPLACYSACNVGRRKGSIPEPKHIVFRTSDCIRSLNVKGKRAVLCEPSGNGLVWVLEIELTQYRTRCFS